MIAPERLGRKIEDAANELLERHKILSPPVNVEKIALAEGVSVERAALAKDISGFLFRSDSSAIIGVNAKHALVRQRFTIAHELGHLFLKHKCDSEVHVDKNFVLKFRDEISVTGEDPHEVHANNFAACLLMPRRMLVEDVHAREYDLIDDESISQLAHRYNVSVQALMIRLSRLFRYTA
jgi:Zn-dependent peptidase ImmA (M78 family)